MPELEAWEKVIITGNNGETFLTSVHGPDYSGDAIPHALTCQHCHAGAPDNTFETMEEAHEGMFADPSAPGESGCAACHDANFARSACDQCHTETVTLTQTSLHTTQQGYITSIEERCACDFNAEGNADFEARCAGCHTTCGQCHISRPNSVGGGFPQITVGYRSHRFAAPDQNEQCTACHGSRVGTDYRGELEGNVADVHSSRGFDCMDCHDGAEVHGDGTEYAHRYEVAGMPRCEDCHGTAGSVSDAVTVDTGTECSRCHGDFSEPPVVPAQLINHAHHIDGAATDCGHCHGGTAPSTTPPNAQCQMCHSQPYKNCTNCHNLVPGPEGYDIDASVIELKIGRNQSPYRPEYDVSIVRHVPVDPGTFDNWGLVLSDFTSVPTWKYSSPHNVIASAPQTQVADGESCALSCHGTAAAPSPYLLRLEDLEEAGSGDQQANIDANLDVVVPASFPPAK